MIMDTAVSASDLEEEQGLSLRLGSSAVDITENGDGGVLKQIIKDGHGDEKPQRGDIVTVHYVGTLENGTKFNSSRDHNEKFKFILGRGEVIKSWDVGVSTMRKGEICKLICRSDYAYKERGNPPLIPPNATLIFEIELFEWCGQDLTSKKDGGIIQQIIESGEGYSYPNDQALVEVALTGRLSDGTVFDQREVKFSLGEGGEYEIPEGLERAIKKLRKNEKSIVKLTPKYTFGSSGNPKLGIPPNTNVEYEVHLKSFEKAKDIWALSPEECLEQAKLFRSKGTEYFKQEKYRLAIKQYKRVINVLKFQKSDNEHDEEVNEIQLAGHLNLSACHLKLKHYLMAKEQAENALQIDPNNVKGHFRMGQALLNLAEPEEAKKSFEKCLSLDPNNKAAMNQLHVCKIKIKEHKETEKRLFSGMFDKFAKDDAKKLAASRLKNDVMSGDLGEWKPGMRINHREMDNSSEDSDSEYHTEDDIDQQLSEFWKVMKSRGQT